MDPTLVPLALFNNKNTKLFIKKNILQNYDIQSDSIGFWRTSETYFNKNHPLHVLYVCTCNGIYSF